MSQILYSHFHTTYVDKLLVTLQPIFVSKMHHIYFICGPEALFYILHFMSIADVSI